MKKKRRDSNELPESRVKLTFNRHFLPPLMGLLMTFAVFGLLNSQLLVATLAEATYKPSVEAVIPRQSPVDDRPRIIINKIGVEAPVIYNQKKIDEVAFQLALRDGVVHYPYTAKPGKPGNTVIFGHSSGQVWAPGNYKFVFTHLDKLQLNDKIFVEYKGTRYIYNITNKSIVYPTNVSVLNQAGKQRLTLITCTPVGTSEKRLIVSAEQIYPKPSSEEIKPSDTQIPENTKLPDSESPSLLESLLGIF